MEEGLEEGARGSGAKVHFDQNIRVNERVGVRLLFLFVTHLICFLSLVRFACLSVPDSMSLSCIHLLRFLVRQCVNIPNLVVLG